MRIRIIGKWLGCILLCAAQLHPPTDAFITDGARPIQRMQKTLTPMYLYRHRVFSDIPEVSGMRILQAIVQGEQNPQTLMD